MKKLSLFAALSLAACAGPRVFSKPGATAQDFAQDKGACRAQALSATAAVTNPFIAVDQQNEITFACLEGRGWR